LAWANEIIRKNSDLFKAGYCGFAYPALAGSQGVEFREPFMRPFAPCFRVAVASLHLYLLSRGAKQRIGTKGNSSRGRSDIVKSDENTTFDGARIGAAFEHGG
jgi:hypothetical protein